jgi:hypothetical protein
VQMAHRVPRARPWAHMMTSLGASKVCTFEPFNRNKRLCCSQQGTHRNKTDIFRVIGHDPFELLSLPVRISFTPKENL